MIVYVAKSKDYYDCDGIDAIFTLREKAQIFLDLHRTCNYYEQYWIEEYELDSKAVVEVGYELGSVYTMDLSLHKDDLGKISPSTGGAHTGPYLKYRHPQNIVKIWENNFTVTVGSPISNEHAEVYLTQEREKRFPNVTF